MTKEPITKNGAEAMRAELHQLKTVARPAVIEAIAVAREHGDLKENAEYHAAREQQSFIEGRLGDLEGKLSNAEIIDPTTLNAGEKIVFSATVTMVRLEDDVEVTYQIVGMDEADIKKGLISYQSPIARAMIGKTVDDEILVPAPGGTVAYEILEVEYK